MIENLVNCVYIVKLFAFGVNIIFPLTLRRGTEEQSHQHWMTHINMRLQKYYDFYESIVRFKKLFRDMTHSLDVHQDMVGVTGGPP